MRPIRPYTVIAALAQLVLFVWAIFAFFDSHYGEATVLMLVLIFIEVDTISSILTFRYNSTRQDKVDLD